MHCSDAMSYTENYYVGIGVIMSDLSVITDFYTKRIYPLQPEKSNNVSEKGPFSRKNKSPHYSLILNSLLVAIY